MMVQIETARTVVRNFCLEDAADLQEILGDPEVMKNLEPPYDLERTTSFLQSFCIDRGGALACDHKASGKLIGYLLFHATEEAVYEMGWIFRKDFWRQGYAFEACRALIEHAFTRMHAHRVFAETIDKVKSVGLMEKLGMKLEGIEKSQVSDAAGSQADLYVYGIMREEYQREATSL